MNILITGASAGIGQASAVHLAQKGHKILMVSRNTAKLKKICEAHPEVALSFSACDLRNKDSINSLLKNEANFFKDIDCLVNNAGLALGKEKFQNNSWDDIECMIDTNVKGLMYLTQKILPFMISNEKGQIINLGSIAGHTGYSGGTVYCATKAAIHMMTEALRHDLGGTNIRVSTIAPGRVETDFSLIRFKGDKEAADKVYQGYRPLSALDLAETITWIAERPAHVNIQHLMIMGTDQPNCTTISPWGQ